MVLPRPARVLQQYPQLLSRTPASVSRRCFSKTSCVQAKPQIIERDDFENNRVELDDSFDGIIDTLDLGTKRSRKSSTSPSRSCAQLHNQQYRQEFDGERVEEVSSETESKKDRQMSELEYISRLTNDERILKPKTKYGIKVEEKENIGEDGEEIEDEEMGRAERRSPAAVIGSKRLGSTHLPKELEQGITDTIEGESQF